MGEGEIASPFSDANSDRITRERLALNSLSRNDPPKTQKNQSQFYALLFLLILRCLMCIHLSAPKGHGTGVVLNLTKWLRRRRFLGIGQEGLVMLEFRARPSNGRFLLSATHFITRREKS